MTESSSPKDNINPKDQEIDQENEGFYHFGGGFAGRDFQGDCIIQYDYSKDSHQDIYNLLKFAEDMKQVCDNYLNQLERLVFFRDCIGLVLIIIVFFMFFSMSNGDWNSANSLDSIKLIKDFILKLIGLWVIILVVGVIINSPIRKLKNRLSYEQKILEETVDLLREAGKIMIREGSWTKLQEIEFKIRLSRFNIGKYQMPESILQETLSKKSKKPQSLKENTSGKSEKTWYNRLMNRVIEGLEKQMESIIFVFVILALTLGFGLITILLATLTR